MIHVAMTLDANVNANRFLLVCVDSIRRTTDEKVIYHVMVNPDDCRSDYLRLAGQIVVKSGGEFDLIDLSKYKSRLSELSQSFWFEIPLATTIPRFAIPEIIDTDERILYLDTDIVLRRSLSLLNNVDLGGRPIGAVRDEGLMLPATATDAQKAKVSRIRTLFGTSLKDPTSLFFQDGQLVIDPASMPSRTWMFDSIIDAWKRLQSNGVENFNDMCLFNEAFVPSGCIHPLPPKFSTAAWYMGNDTMEEIERTARDVGIDRLDVKFMNKIHGTSYRSVFERVMVDAVIYHYNGPKASMFFDPNGGSVSEDLTEKYLMARSYAEGH